MIDTADVSVGDWVKIYDDRLDSTPASGRIIEKFRLVEGSHVTRISVKVRRSDKIPVVLTERLPCYYMAKIEDETEQALLALTHIGT